MCIRDRSNYTWTNITSTVAGAPPPRYSDGAISYDSTHGYVLLHGGFNFTCQMWAGSSCSQGTNTFLSDTWEYSAGAWTNVTFSPSPGYRALAGLADDTSAGGVILFGGSTCAQVSCPIGNTNRFFVNSTWVWAGSPPISGLTATVSRSFADIGVKLHFWASLLGGAPPIQISWNFGDGNLGTGSTLNHTYFVTGAYFPQVWANDTAGHKTTSVTHVTVASRLAIMPTASPNPTDAGLPVLFGIGQASGTPPYSYSWIFGDSGSSLQANPTHSYRSAGSYTPHAWLNDSGGESVNASINVTVNLAVNISRLNATPNPSNLGEPVNFTSTVGGGTGSYSYAWAFGDGGTGGNLRNITHIYTTNGPFSATLSVTDAAGQAVAKSVNISIALNASIFSNVTLGAVPLPASFTGNVRGGVPGYTYLWKLGDGTSSTQANPNTYTTRPVPIGWPCWSRTAWAIRRARGGWSSRSQAAARSRSRST